MRTPRCVQSGCRESGAARVHAASGWIASGLWIAAFIGCQDAPPLDMPEPAEAPAPAPVSELPAGIVIDLGSDTPAYRLEGFSLPERVGSRLASWSEGELSTIGFDVRGGARNYLLTFLGEPYHMLGEVPVGISVNQRPLAEARLAPGWAGYQFLVPGQRISGGRNQLAFQYGKTGRPSDFDTGSSDVRSLSVRFDQVQLQPIEARVSLAFGSKNAFALAALREGWARDPSDRGTGTWTVAARAGVTFYIDEPKAGPEVYHVSLTARTPRGVAERAVQVTLNGAVLGSLVFGEKKSTAGIDVPRERLSDRNELGLEFSKLESPAELDASSKDRRLLGLRVFELGVEPRVTVIEPAASERAAEPVVADPDARERRAAASLK